MIKADVLTTNRDWKKLIKTPHLYINKKLKKIDKKTKLFKNNNCNFTLLLSGDSEIKKLNIKFRKINKTTDILSFPFYEKKPLIKLLKNKKNLRSYYLIIFNNFFSNFFMIEKSRLDLWRYPNK